MHSPQLQQYPPRADRQLGFTLIELMIAVTLSAIVLSLAVPSFRAMVQNNRQITRLNDLVTDLAYARSEAVRRGVAVIICPRDADGDGTVDVAATGDSCSASTDWSSGWVIFLDEDGDNALAAPADVLRLYAGPVGDLSLVYGRNSIQYNPQGLAIGFAGTFALCDSRGASDARGRVVNNTGRVSEVTGGLTCP
jgi:type IV fimbrial biogenesis protein FimT